MLELSGSLKTSVLSYVSVGMYTGNTPKKSTDTFHQCNFIGYANLQPQQFQLHDDTLTPVNH